jgi:hypothetical protein
MASIAAISQRCRILAPNTPGIRVKQVAEIFALPGVVGCLVLSWAGLEKLRDRAPLASVAAEIGLPRRLADAAAIAVPVVELGTVLAVLAGLSYLPSALFAVLGVVFAATGAWSLLAGKALSCACFGASERRLGWPQLAALPLWLLVAWSAVRIPPVGITERLAAAAAGLLLLAIIRAIPALRLGAVARSDRRAFMGGS